MAYTPDYIAMFRKRVMSLPGIEDKNKEDIFKQSFQLVKDVTDFLETMFRAMDTVFANTGDDSPEQIDGILVLYNIIRPYSGFFMKDIIGQEAVEQMERLEKIYTKAVLAAKQND